MQPDRSNYEIWLSDWLDGKLTGQQAEQFRSFLDENPDLKEEADFLAHSQLTPGNESWPGKNLLKKTAAELPPSQIEYLSVAYLENDLTPEQLDDLNQNIDQNRESGELFNSVQKIKLIPLPYGYRYKNHLKKPVPGAGVFRLSLTGLSAAAAIALIILSYIFVPRLIPVKKDISALNNDPLDEPIIVNTQVFRAPAEEIPRPEIINETPERIIPQTLSPGTEDQTILTAAVDSSSVIRRLMPGFRIDSLPHFNIDLKTELYKYSLAVSTIKIKEVLYDDERNRLSKFMARIFREKILKEEPGSDTPVKPYEIAAAGIDGLNRLFGWDMALVKVTDEEGDLKSIYFSSRLLKFNAPVKKTDLAE